MDNEERPWQQRLREAVRSCAERALPSGNKLSLGAFSEPPGDEQTRKALVQLHALLRRRRRNGLKRARRNRKEN